MAKEKIPKTNAMRILDRLKISYEVLSYQCDEFIDGIHTADTLGIPHENCFKTLVLQGKSKGYSVFVLPIEEELNLKECAKAVNECEGHQHRHRLYSRLLYCPWHEKGISDHFPRECA